LQPTAISGKSAGAGNRRFLLQNGLTFIKTCGGVWSLLWSLRVEDSHTTPSCTTDMRAIAASGRLAAEREEALRLACGAEPVVRPRRGVARSGVPKP
jgi:hypothetical protein